MRSPIDVLADHIRQHGPVPTVCVAFYGPQHGWGSLRLEINLDRHGSPVFVALRRCGWGDGECNKYFCAGCEHPSNPLRGSRSRLSEAMAADLVAAIAEKEGRLVFHAPLLDSRAAMTVLQRLHAVGRVEEQDLDAARTWVEAQEAMRLLGEGGVMA